MQKYAKLKEIEPLLIELGSYYSDSEIEAAAFRYCVKHLTEDHFSTPNRTGQVMDYISDLFLL